MGTDGTNFTDFAKQQVDLGGQLAKQAAPLVQVHNLPGGHGDYMLGLRDAAGGAVTWAEKHTPPPPRAYTAQTLQGLVDLVMDHAPEPADDKGSVHAPCNKTAVMVSIKAVDVLLDEADRRERFAFPLVLSQAMTRIKDLDGEEDPDGEGEEDDSAYAFTQRGFIDLLRRQIDGEVRPDNLLEQVRAIKFKSSSEGETTIKTGRESMGRTVNSEVLGVDLASFPDEVGLTVPVFDNARDSDGHPFRHTVVCTLDVDVVRQRFLLRPKAGQIAWAEQEALDWLVNELEEALVLRPTVRVFAATA